MTVSSSIQTTTVHFQSQGVSIPAYLASPSEASGLPIIIVIQEVFGVNSHIREVTERIAREGYIAIAPHIYHRQAPGFEVGYSDKDLELGRQYKNGTLADELLSDIKGAIAHAKSKFENIPETAGCIGFCFGGHVAYLAATLPEVTATASFYGAGICQFIPGGGPPTITHTAEIGGKIHLYFGLQDPLIPISDIDDIAAKLDECDIDHRIYRYSEASHGFFCDQRESYDEASAVDAWSQVKSLFEGTLKRS